MRFHHFFGCAGILSFRLAVQVARADRGDVQKRSERN